MFVSRALFLIPLVLISTSCAEIPSGRYTLDSIRVEGNAEVDDDEIENKIASRETSKFMGLFPGFIYDYEIFDRFVLERDLERIERYYRARGYYRARVRAGRVTYSGRGARVQIIVEEGPPIIIERFDVHGLDDLPPEIAADIRARAASELKLGDVFEEENFSETDGVLQRALADHGYAFARLRRVAEVNLPKNAVSIGFWVNPGSQAKFGEVTIEGLGNLPEPAVRRAIDIEPGTPYSQSELDEAKTALLNLGVFGSANVEPDTEAARKREVAADVVPIRVTLEPSKLRSVHVGGGVQVDTQQTNVHLTVGWEDANFFGGFRKFLVEAVPGAVVYPTRLPTFDTPERLLPQGRIRTEFRQPGFFEARTNAMVRAEISVYPILLSASRDPTFPVLGYEDFRTSVGAERSLWKLYGALSHNIQINNPFAYVGTIDPDLHMVLVSYPQLFATLDLRDSSVSPHEGLYLAMDVQVAGVGGDARDIKLRPEARFFIPVSRRVTLAARGGIGLLYPDNYGDTLDVNANQGAGMGSPLADTAARADWVRDVQLLFLRGLFSGGAGSNRGYGAREIGPHGVVPFYNPSQSSESLVSRCDVTSMEYSAALCDLPLGGLTQWEASLELRYPIMGPFSGTVFTDAADVSSRTTWFRFDRPHLSVGLGFRFETPVGPIRFDFGYRLPGLQAPATPDEGTPAELFGLPAAISLGIGEAF